MEATVQQMLGEFLGAMGFEAMAHDVQSETDRARLQRYARVVLKQLPADRKRAVHSRFALLGLV
jgi:hypothetical protein